MDKTALKKYRQHIKDATKRNVGFTLTLEEWWNIWQASGKWDERGRGKGKYCMSRYGDLGPYTTGNVFIQLFSDNLSQAHKGKIQGPPTEEQRKKNSDSMKGKQNSLGVVRDEAFKKNASEKMKIVWAERKAKKSTINGTSN